MNKVCLGRALVQVVDVLAPRLRVAERADGGVRDCVDAGNRARDGGGHVWGAAGERGGRGGGSVRAGDGGVRGERVV